MRSTPRTTRAGTLRDTQRPVGDARPVSTWRRRTIIPTVWLRATIWSASSWVLSAALDEIRQYGASSVQVSRRMNALLDRLAAEAPAGRQAGIELHRARLAATMARGLVDPADLEFAVRADRQGIGQGAATRLS